jgi:hypothetical protein
MVVHSRFSGRKIDGLAKSRNIDRDTGSGIRKHRFVENNVTRDVYATSGSIKTLVPLMHGTIA